MSEHFSKHLSNIKTPHVEVPFNKRKLKNAVKSVYFDKGNVSKDSSLFDDLKNMSFKKLIPAGLLAVFLFTFIGQNIVSWQNTAYAQELIEEAIEKIESEPLTEAQQEALSTIQILEELKKEGELKFTGEEPYFPEFENGPERTVQKFSFTDPDLSTDVIINVVDGKEVFFTLDHLLSQLLTQKIELIVDSSGEVKGLNELSEQLKDPQLDRFWLKELVKRNNIEWIKEVPGLYGLTESQVFDEDQWNVYLVEKVLPAIQPLVSEAEVYISDLAGSADPENSIYTYVVDVLKITGQKKKDESAQSEIQKGIEKLKALNTEEAEMKIAVLKKALASENLKYYPDLLGNSTQNLSFIYPGQEEQIRVNLSMDHADSTEQFLSIYLVSEDFDFAKKEWIDVKTQNGKISNLPELESKLKDSAMDDDVLNFIVQQQNESFAGYVESDMDQGSKPYMLNPPNEYEVEQLKQLLMNAEVPVLERSGIPAAFNSEMKDFSPEDADPEILYSLAIYPLGQSSNKSSSEAIEKLDQVIENLKGSVDLENKATLEILKKALDADDLKYEGEVDSWDDNQPVEAEKLSFTDKTYANNVSVVIHPDGELYFNLNPESYGKPETFNIEINDRFEVTNLAELEEKLKDPNLNESWLKELIKMDNHDAIIVPFDPHSPPFDEMDPQDKKGTILCNEAAQKVVDQITPLIQTAQVSIQGTAMDCGDKKPYPETLNDIEFTRFSLDLLPITKK